MRLMSSFFIISPSGMCEGGRILHHLRNNIGDERNTIILAGFQAEGTLGRKLSEGIKDVLIFGLPVKVRAEVQMAHEYSAHADWKELVAHVQAFDKAPEQVILVHGEPDAATALAQQLGQSVASKIHIAKLGESIEF